MALYGWAPRLSAAAFGMLGRALAFGMLGRLPQLPQALLDVSPYTHMSALPTLELSVAVALWRWGSLGSGAGTWSV